MITLSLVRSGLAQTVLVYLATFAALALLGLVLAQWTWVWLGPRPESRAQVAIQAAGRLEAARSMFGSAQSNRSGAVPTGLAIRLLGSVAATAGHTGYALLQLDANQILAVPEGNDIVPGVRLAEVGTDHVILERGGIRETLAWPEKKPVSQSATLPNQ